MEMYGNLNNREFIIKCNKIVTIKSVHFVFYVITENEWPTSNNIIKA